MWKCHKRYMVHVHVITTDIDTDVHVQYAYIYTCIYIRMYIHVYIYIPKMKHATGCVMFQEEGHGGGASSGH